jgi:osmoprotectant transport system permease protein
MTAPVLASAAPFIDWSWIRVNSDLVVADLVQHVELSAIAVGCGVIIAIPLALFAWQVRPSRSVVLGFAALLYTIPSIALFVLIQPLTGYFSLCTAEVALVGYTLLILIRNVLTGLDAATDDVREAARAMGYTPVGAAVHVYFPIALPALFAGMRVATVTVVGLVTITAFIGWGGLGQLIITGFSESFYTPIIVGLVLSIALAAVGDALFVGLERATVRWRQVRA